MGNEVVKKDILAQYVHDAVDIEVRRHTLNKMRDDLIISRDKGLEEQERAISLLNSKHERKIKKIELELGSIEAKHTSKVSSVEQEIKINEDKIDEVKKKPSEVSRSFSSDSFPIVFGFLGAIVGVVAFVIFGELGIFSTDSELIKGIILWLSMLLGGIFGALISYRKQKADWIKDCRNSDRYTIQTANSNIQKLQAEQQEELTTYKKELSQKQSERIALGEQQQLERAEAENDLANEQKIYAELTGHIDVISEKLDTVDSQLREFYSVNLIPPNYRSIECVIAFDQMFRNDLVDTMREAALLYDERVFRGEMITGLNKIYEAINELGGLMSETVSVLRQIESNTSRMCDELCEVSSNLVRMNANVTGHLSTMSSNLSSGFETISKGQSRIETELEYNRYANEAIRANSDRMKWYAEQRWQGLL